MMPDTERRTLLLVDDEELLLRSFARAFRALRAPWDVSLAGDAAQALAALEQRPFDVVVSDVRMPGMDGITMLEEVAKRWPKAMRVVQSGDADPTLRVRALGVAHQFLAKPWDVGQLSQALMRAFTLQAALADPIVRTATTGITALPSKRGLLDKLREAVADDRTDFKQIANIVSGDPAIAAKLLQAVNSAFFAAPKRVTRIDEAIALLGLGTVRSLAQAEQVLAVFGNVPGIDSMQRRSADVASLARELASPETRDDAFAIGLLHDVGSLVVAVSNVEVAADAHQVRAAIGAYLLHLWALPWSVVEGVATHRQLNLEGTAPLSAAEAVALAIELLDRPVTALSTLKQSPRLAPRWAQLEALAKRATAGAR